MNPHLYPRPADTGLLPRNKPHSGASLLPLQVFEEEGRWRRPCAECGRCPLVVCTPAAPPTPPRPRPPRSLALGVDDAASSARCCSMLLVGGKDVSSVYCSSHCSRSCGACMHVSHVPSFSSTNLDGSSEFPNSSAFSDVVHFSTKLQRMP